MCLVLYLVSKNGHLRKNLSQKMVNPRDVAGMQKKKKTKYLVCLFSPSLMVGPLWPTGRASAFSVIGPGFRSYQ